MSQAAPGEQRDAVLEIVCAEVIQFDPAQALAIADRYSGGNYSLLENLVHQWAEQDEHGAGEYARGKPPSEIRNRLLGRLALTQAKTNPARAASELLAQIPPGDIQDEAVISVLHQWTLRDPNAALAWVRLFPDGALRDRAMKEVAAAWRSSGR